MNALAFLKSLPNLPNSVEHGKIGRPSNQELKRWLKSGSVLVNGGKPLPTDEVDFPVNQLVFFPGGNRKTTFVSVEGKKPTPEEAKAVLDARRCCKERLKDCPIDFNCPYDEIILNAKYLPMDEAYAQIQLRR